MITLTPTKDIDRRCNMCKVDVNVYELSLDGTVITLCPNCCLRVSQLLLKTMEVDYE